VVGAASGSTAALSAVRSERLDRRVVRGQIQHAVAAGDDLDPLRPLKQPAQEGDRPLRFHGVAPRPEPHVYRAIPACHDRPRRRAGRIVADQQHVAGHGGRLLLRVEDDDLDVEDADRLGVGRAGAGDEEDSEEQYAQHELIVAPRLARVNAPPVYPQRVTAT
jgi:hypothetical protein